MIKQKKLLLKCFDNSVIILSFILDDGYTVKRKGTKEEIEIEITRASTGFPENRLPIISWEEIDDSDIPSDRTFRNAWVTKKKKVIEHDMDKAREILKENLRRKRQPLLDALDIEYQRADESDDIIKKLEIAIKKQKLRDITKHPDIEKAKTIEELKKITVEGI